MEDFLVRWKRALLVGVLGGLIHSLVIGGLYIYLHGPELFGYSPSSNTVEVFELIHIYMITGSFILGAVPAVLYVERQLISPIVTLLVFVIGLLLSSPGGLEPGAGQSGATNFAFYFSLWIIPLSIAGLIGGVEYTAKLLIHTDTNHQSQTD